MNIKWILLLLPINLFAQTHNAAPGKGTAAGPQLYAFHSLTMDDFVTTKPEKGGTVIYNYDSSGMSIDGTIEINAAKKYISIIYTADKKNVMKAVIDSKTETDTSYTYKARWTDTNEKTEISVSKSDPVKVIKVLFGPHKGDYANYWDRIYNYAVSRSN